MAFTNAPSKDTYSSHRIPLAYGLQLRPVSSIMGNSSLGPGLAERGIYQDAGMVNLIPYKGIDGQSLESFTRPPIVGHRVTNVATDAYVRGVYVWEKDSTNTYYFMVCGTRVFTSTTGANDSWTNVQTLSAGVSKRAPVGFTEFIDATNVKKLILVDGINGYVFTSNAAPTQITDVDFPTPHIPYPVFIDGYVFVAKKDTGDIYNCNLNDPLNWTAGSFISSELYPDDLKALVKVNNYLLAIGTHGSEYFYDAANATGSPLARYEGGSLPFGTYIPASIAVNKNTVVMIANNNDGESSIKVIEDFKHNDIDPTFVIPLINSRLNSTFRGSKATDNDSIRGMFAKVDGQLMYVLNIRANYPDADKSLANPCLAYCFTTKLWTEFRLNTSTEQPLPLASATFANQKSNVTYVGGFVGDYPFFGTFSDSVAATFNNARDEITNFDVTLIQTEIRTPKLDFGTLNQKTMSRLGLVCDVGGGSNTVDGAISISVSYNDYDYNYNQFATDRTISIGVDTPSDFPFITQLGRFRERSLRIRTQQARPVRFRLCEMDINKHSQ